MNIEIYVAKAYGRYLFVAYVFSTSFSQMVYRIDFILIKRYFYKIAFSLFP